MIKQFFKWISRKRLANDTIMRMDAFKLKVKKDRIDKRDYKYESAGVFSEKADLSRSAPPVKNQGVIASCGSHAAITCYETMMKLQGKPDVPLSELFHYYMVRQADFENNFPKDSGQSLRNAMKVMSKVGNVPEILHSYNTLNYNIPPRLFNTVKSMGRFWKVKEYYRISDVSSLKSSLNSNQPVCLGIPISQNFRSYKSGIIKYEGNSLGGHAMVVLGYDDGRKAFFVQNSWGTGWGEKGYGWLSYDYLNDASWFDAWQMIPISYTEVM